MKRRFVFDPNRCVGCHACVVACATTHGPCSKTGRQKSTRHWRTVQTFNPSRHPLLRMQHLSLACNHCEDPACLRHCPARAYTRDKATGAVLHHPERCMGCRYCTWACPYDAPKYSEATGVIEKCDFCLDLLREGTDPACVSRCPLNALAVEESGGEIPAEQDAERPPGFPESPLRPAIRFVGLRREAPPDMKVEGARLARFLDPILKVPPPKITLRSEWPLVVFTQVYTLLTAWLAASMLGGPSLNFGVFLLLGTLAPGLSGMHLGKKERAWRAPLNVFSSWLSREIALVGLFLIMGSAYLLTGNRDYGWMAAAIGFAGLIAIDRIYYLARPGSRGNLHSAQAVLGAAFLLGIIAQLPVLAISAGILKLILYVSRKLMRNDGFIKWLLSGLRIALGFLPPIFLRHTPVLTLCLVLLGEAIDRLEFYLELEFDSPERELAVKMLRIFRPMGANTPWEILWRTLRSRAENFQKSSMPEAQMMEEKNSNQAG